MKDFIKWLGVNEKVAKVVVWLLIIMICLIVVNTCFDSIGIPHYAITYDNLIMINTNEIMDTIFDIVMTILNFYTIVLLVFRIKETKAIFKYAIIYVLLNWVISEVFGYVPSQIFIFVYNMVFSYLYSNKKVRYIFYILFAIALNIMIQGIWFTIKAEFINYNEIGSLTKTILSIDYFIIMAVIILVKEIYLKKRGGKLCHTEDQIAYYGSENSKMKAN